MQCTKAFEIIHNQNTIYKHRGLMLTKNEFTSYTARVYCDILHKMRIIVIHFSDAKRCKKDTAYNV